MGEPNFTERQRHLRNIVVMALADGSIGQREVERVADRCVELGLGQADLQSALAFGLGDDAALELPAAQSAREALLADLISVMAADGHLAESEKRLFALAAARMNIVGERLDQIITSVVREMPSRPSVDDLA